MWSESSPRDQSRLFEQAVFGDQGKALTWNGSMPVLPIIAVSNSGEASLSLGR